LEGKTVTGRLLGKRVIVTDPTEYNGADIVALFREEGAEVFAKPPSTVSISRPCTVVVFDGAAEMICCTQSGRQVGFSPKRRAGLVTTALTGKDATPENPARKNSGPRRSIRNTPLRRSARPPVRVIALDLEQLWFYSPR
jgi:hypothetical protein